MKGSQDARTRAAAELLESPPRIVERILREDRINGKGIQRGQDRDGKLYACEYIPGASISVRAKKEDEAHRSSDGKAEPRTQSASAK